MKNAISKVSWGNLGRRTAHLLVLSSVLILAACSQETPSKPETTAKAAPVEGSSTLSILATSDLRDIEEIAAQVKTATGVQITFKFGGTFESTDLVQNGKAGTDAAWFANAKYLLSDPAGQARVRQQEKIMLSPLVIGLNTSAAKKLKWDNGAKVTWADVKNAAKNGQLRYAMSNPASSNQGFMAVMGVAAAVAGKSEALAAGDVNREAVREFLAGYKLVGDNSTYLAQKFKERQGDDINAFINYESWLLSMNAKGDLKEPLTLIYPHEGVATADYPLMLLNEAKLENYRKVVDYLKTDAAQNWFAEKTLRRPITPDAAKKNAGLFPANQLLVELPFSTNRGVADSLIDAYLNEFRVPIASTFVLDVSGSMNDNDRIGKLKASLKDLAGQDSSITGRFARLNSREKIWFLPFSYAPGTPTSFVIPAAGKPQEKAAMFAAIGEYLSGLKAEGGTALYDATLVAVRNMAAERDKNPENAYSVVVFTDGKRTQGIEMDAFIQGYNELFAGQKATKKIPVFLVLYAEGEAGALQKIADLSGGKVFDARNQPLNVVFKDIRSYQ